MIVNDRQNVRELDGATTVELLEPLHVPRSQSRGLIHLALDVVDVDVATARVTASGGRCLSAPFRTWHSMNAGSRSCSSVVR